MPAPPRLFGDLRAAFYSRRVCMEDYEKRTFIRLGMGTCDASCSNERWWPVWRTPILEKPDSSMIGRTYEVDLDKYFYVSPQTEHAWSRIP